MALKNYTKLLANYTLQKAIEKYYKLVEVNGEDDKNSMKKNDT